MGGAGGRVSGHWGIMVELEDRVVAPDEDPMRQLTASSDLETIGSARTGPVETVGPLKVRGFTEFGWCVALMCPAPSNRWTWRRPQRHWQVGCRIEFSTRK
jgi:hypothetical protein